MLNTLTLKNFTVFKQANVRWAPGLNVIVGENGTGKTHLLKVAYSILYVSFRGEKESGLTKPTKDYLETAIAKKLSAVFLPDRLGSLTHTPGRLRCEVSCQFAAAQQQHLTFSFTVNNTTKVTLEQIPSHWFKNLPIYLPTRELITIYPEFLSWYETAHLPFEQTWRDTCLLLGTPLAKDQQPFKPLLKPLEAAMKGTVELAKNGRFYLNSAGNKMEMQLVAEGFRKLALIARLIANGHLGNQSCLFWDEPESNLNPKMIKMIAGVLLHLCQQGVQVFIASHSLFLLRELDILLNSNEFKEIAARFIGLHYSDEHIVIEQGDTIDNIGDIDALQEELYQSDRYLDLEA